MRSTTGISLLISLVLSLCVSAQPFGPSHRSGSLDEDNIINTKQELKREQKIRKEALNSKKSSEYYARKRHKLTKLQSHKPKRKKVDHEVVYVNKKR
jgi:hypothetical protein